MLTIINPSLSYYMIAYHDYSCTSDSQLFADWPNGIIPELNLFDIIWNRLYDL